MANLQEIANKFRIAEHYLNSKEDGLLVVASSMTDLIKDLNKSEKRGIDENGKQSIITKLEKLTEFCKEVKNSTF
jgi:hypothetical protein|tara:strand:- start:2678 stop:2902 length:225 start_codon:yes stop_codon:yes gene_type:complete